MMSTMESLEEEEEEEEEAEEEEEEVKFLGLPSEETVTP